MDLMVDLETLSTKPNAAIVSIGAVLFEPHGDMPIVTNNGTEAYFYRRVDLDSMFAIGGHVEQSTMLWWMGDHDDNGNPMAPAREEAFNPNDRTHIAAVWLQLCAFCKHNGVERIWSHGLTFDVAILQNYSSSHDMAWPVSFRNNRDTRTLFDDAPKVVLDAAHDELKPWPIMNMFVHHPVFDSYVQARMVQAAKRHLRGASHG